MKRKLIMSVAVLLMLVAIVFPIAEARGSMRNASGSCGMNHVGKSVTFSGHTSSSEDEDVIRVTIILQEKRDGTWYGISSRTKTEQNSDFAGTSKDYTVSGGHYYRVYASHYARTGDVVSSSSSSSEAIWIPE